MAVRWAVLFAVLAGCAEPALTANMRFTPDGVSVRPTLSGSFGGLSVAVGG